jgi:hypothetical protein
MRVRLDRNQNVGNLGRFYRISLNKHILDLVMGRSTRAKLCPEKRIHKNIFVDSFPMNADTAADEAPIFALFRSGRSKALGPF